MMKASDITPKPAPRGVVKLRHLTRDRVELVWLRPGGLSEVAIPITRSEALDLADRILTSLHEGAS